MDKIDLEELARLASAATPGPWKEGRHDMFSIVEGAHAKYIYANSIPVAISTGEEKDCERVLADARYIAAACNHAPELVARVRELEERIAELTQENSGHKRVIHILENKVLALKGKPIPMEPRQFIPSSNRSNAKEAGE